MLRLLVFDLWWCAVNRHVSIFLPAEHFQRSSNHCNSIAEELANAIRQHIPFKGHSIVFEIRPTHSGELPETKGVVYVRT